MIKSNFVYIHSSTLKTLGGHCEDTSLMYVSIKVRKVDNLVRLKQMDNVMILHALL